MDVTMPQFGETVTEGTITRWFKQVGETVAADEPLFEVSTDKVDSEVPAPAAGVVSEILVAEGDTVDVGVRLAVISDSAEPAAAAPRRRSRARTGRARARRCTRTRAASRCARAACRARAGTARGPGSRRSGAGCRARGRERRTAAARSSRRRSCAA